MARDNNIVMENARIFFRNFAGKESDFNREGDRNFCVAVDDQLAEALIQDGWNVKYTKPREEGDEVQAYLQVSVSFKVRAPQIVMIGSQTKKRTRLDESMIEMLDWAEIETVDLIISPYHWGPINGKSGLKAYLQDLFITIVENPLELKYANLEESVQPRSGSFDE